MSSSSWNLDILQNEQILIRMQSVEFLYAPAFNLNMFPKKYCFLSLKHVDFSDSNLKLEVISTLPETVSELVVKNCNITQLPECFNIVYLDISNNFLPNLSTSKTFPNLEHLCVQGNDFETIEYHRESFPSLRKLECGSSKCKFVSFLVIQEVISEQISIELSSETNLLLPPNSLIYQKSALKTYIETPEMNVDNLEAMLWLTGESKKVFERFVLSDKRLLLKKINFSALQNILQMNSLLQINHLILSKIDLSSLPHLHQLKSLKFLNISKNIISDMANVLLPDSLINIDLSENPIKNLKLNLQQVPLLSYLKAGSKETVTLDREILLKVLSKALVLDILPKFKDSLRSPPFSSLSENTEELQHFLNVEECDLSLAKIGEASIDYVESQLQQFTMHITKVILSEQRCVATNDCKTLNRMLSDLGLMKLKHLDLEFCELEYFPNIRQLKVLSHLNVTGNHLKSQQIKIDFIHETLQSLQLVDCNLKFAFDLSNLPNLVELDVSQNKINSLQQFNKNSSLISLNIQRNPLEDVGINMKNFVQLRILKIGSSTTKYVSFNLLRRMADELLNH